MNIWEAIGVVEQMKRRKATLAAAERTSAYSKRIGAQHHDEVTALEMVLDVARRASR